MMWLKNPVPMADERRESLRTGSHPPYRWLTSAEHHIDVIVKLCSGSVLGRYLAVTSIDSGLPRLTDRQRAAKWECRSGVPYSPRLTGTEELFFQRDGPDSPGYDEWYVFDGQPTDLGEIMEGNPFLLELAPRPGRLMVFVNYPAFVLDDSWSPEQPLATMFWTQMEWIKPESYIGDGRDCLMFVSRNDQLFELVLQRLSGGFPA